MECSRCSVCGVDSVFLRILRFANDGLFVGKLNIGDSFTSSDAAFRFALAKGRLPAFTQYRANLPCFNKRRRKDQPFATVKLALRGVASLREAHKRPFLINPNADVQGVFGRFCSDSMLGCVHTLLAGLRRASLIGVDRLGPRRLLTLHPTLEQQWHTEMVPYLQGGMGPEFTHVPVSPKELKAWQVTLRQRFCHNMMKAQWAFLHRLSRIWLE
jgi:hypothetical protein